MRLLGIETSCSLFSVAATDGDELLSFHQADGTGRPSTGLPPLIERVMAETGWGWQDLDAFALSIGPGSFTGLRVGVTTVKTLAWAVHKPVVPVSTLEVIAQNLHDSDVREIRLFMDARKGKVYTARFRPGESGLVERLSPDRLCLPEEALRDLQEQALLVGDGVRRYADWVHAAGIEEMRVAQSLTWIPRADRLCRLAYRHSPTARVDDPHTLVPQYLYSEKSDITGW